jgi:hypothetical protein
MTTIMLLLMNAALPAVMHVAFGAPFLGDTLFVGDIGAFVNAWLRPIPFLWGPAYLVGLIAEVLGFKLACAVVGAPEIPESL